LGFEHCGSEYSLNVAITVITLKENTLGNLPHRFIFHLVTVPFLGLAMLALFNRFAIYQKTPKKSPHH